MAVPFTTDIFSPDFVHLTKLSNDNSSINYIIHMTKDTQSILAVFLKNVFLQTISHGKRELLNLNFIWLMDYRSK